MKIFRHAMMLMTAVLAAAALSGCSEEALREESDYGYVQFKLYKAASYSPGTKAAAIDYLGDISKARITMRYMGTVMNQTLVFSAADKDKAEYGIRSEKLQLLAGEYEVLSFAVFDKNDNEGPSVTDIDVHNFSVVPGGMTVHEMTVGTSVVPSRGNVKFTLVKDMSSFEDVPTKALDHHTFDEAEYVTVRVEQVSDNRQITFENIPSKFSIHFNDDENDENIYPEGYETYKDFGYQTSSLQTDSLLSLLAGDYRIRSYTLSDGTRTAFETRSFDRASAPQFSVSDNKVQNLFVPVALSEDAPYIQDYYALYEIWKSLDGPNWYYRGENYAEGTNWDFNKDPDLWGDQPGVRIHPNGRVAALDVTDFGIRGDLSPAIGQLTELVQFYLSTHNDINNIDTDEPGTGLEMLSRTRMDRHKKYMSELNPLTQLSEPIAFSFTEKKKTVPEIALYAKGMTEQQIFEMENGGAELLDANTGTLTSGLTSLPEEIGRLSKLEYLYIANCELETLPSAEAMAGLVSLTDFELYNCPKLQLTDDVVASLGALPELISMNLSNNSHWTSEQCDNLFRAFAYGPSAEKIQIVYFRNNQLDALKGDYFSKFKKIGLLDLVNNKISLVERFGADISPVQVYLDYNNITEIPDNEGDQVFCNIDDIETLSVTHNRLEAFPDIFDANAVFIIGSVDFSYNNISRVSGGDSFKGIRVNTLSLASNKFTEYPLEFTHSNSIVSVYNFRGNGMTKIDEDAFDYKKPNRDKLTYTLSFDLTYNRLSDLPVTFGDSAFPYIYSIDLSFNAFKQFPYEPLNYVSLTAMAIRGQRDDKGRRILKEWPQGLYNHRGLRGFYIGSNDYERIDDTISTLIYRFDISDNPNIEFDASDICYAWRAGAYFLMYDKTQNILNCPQMLD